MPLPGMQATYPDGQWIVIQNVLGFPHAQPAQYQDSTILYLNKGEKPNTNLQKKILVRILITNKFYPHTGFSVQITLWDIELTALISKAYQKMWCICRQSGDHGPESYHSL